MPNDARDVSQMLAGRVDTLVRELLPHGKRVGAEWVAPSLSGSSTRSLSVHLTRRKAGVWADFASAEAGDALDLVAAVRYAGNKKDALRWARAWLGVADTAPAARARPAPSPAPAEPDAEAAERAGAARRLWLAAEPQLRGTPVANYLERRGIDLAELARQPRSLRFHPALWCREAERSLPAMVAAIGAPNGEHVATHRTWLQQEAGGQWGKAHVENPKMTLGGYAGGCIRLWRGASGKPLAQALPTEPVVIAEGIETGLSIAVACPHLRVLCAVSLANLARIVLPPSVLHVIVAADNDAPGSAAAAGLQRAIDRLVSEGRNVRIARSSVGKDFNDALVAAEQ